MGSVIQSKDSEDFLTFWEDPKFEPQGSPPDNRFPDDCWSPIRGQSLNPAGSSMDGLPEPNSVRGVD